MGAAAVSSVILSILNICVISLFLVLQVSYMHGPNVEESQKIKIVFFLVDVSLYVRVVPTGRWLTALALKNKSLTSIVSSQVR